MVPACTCTHGQCVWGASECKSVGRCRRCGGVSGAWDGASHKKHARLCLNRDRAACVRIAAVVLRLLLSDAANHHEVLVHGRSTHLCLDVLLG